MRMQQTYIQTDRQTRFYATDIKYESTNTSTYSEHATKTQQYLLCNRIFGI